MVSVLALSVAHSVASVGSVTAGAVVVEAYRYFV
jgi:hypothetical protein